jgi:hypothetical protein
MINLLPTEEKKKNYLFFHVRLGVFYMILMSVVFVLFSIALSPAYFFSVINEGVANNKYQSVLNTPIQDVPEETMNIINEVNSQIDIIEKTKKQNFILTSSIIDPLLFSRMTDIKILNISYQKSQKNEEEIKTVKVTGIAPNRERLLLFKQILENNNFFEKVDLPISNFIRGEDINFELTLFLKK